jgi:hypothetical protein
VNCADTCIPDENPAAGAPDLDLQEDAPVPGRGNPVRHVIAQGAAGDINCIIIFPRNVHIRSVIDNSF